MRAVGGDVGVVKLKEPILEVPLIRDDFPLIGSSFSVIIGRSRDPGLRTTIDVTVRDHQY